MHGKILGRPGRLVNVFVGREIPTGARRSLRASFLTQSRQNAKHRKEAAGGKTNNAAKRIGRYFPRDSTISQQLDIPALICTVVSLKRVASFPQDLFHIFKLLCESLPPCAFASKKANPVAQHWRHASATPI
ncbi:MAG: hypothetical protein HOL01_22735 [Planctomycetaceae bacterium]|nr:hypothetical protein [Planctomycetaceae bacterium]MBT6497354.1 hypothetical protein [Planctomycetaceae bacterium]